MKKSGTKKNPFADDYKPYGVNTGPRGNPAQWKRAFEERFSPDEARKILGQDITDSQGEWAILGLKIDVSWAEVKSAFRKLSLECQAAFGINPDPVAELKFKKIRAAYSLIAEKFGEKA